MVERNLGKESKTKLTAIVQKKVHKNTKKARGKKLFIGAKTPKNAHNSVLSP